MGTKGRLVKFYSGVSTRAEVVHLISQLFNTDGGPGSGNHNHKGRPGQRGGSAKGESPAQNEPKSVSKEDELYQRVESARAKRDEARKKSDELEPAKSQWVEKILKANAEGKMDEVMGEYKKWEEEYLKAREAYLDADKEVEKAKKEYEDYRENAAVVKEQEEIEASGLTEADWRRKKALNYYGTTDDFREAGYLLPDGKMLNFCGSKGQHYGMRGNDHRDIAGMYANPSYGGSREMVRFMSDGNIRVMAESPGVDICSEIEPSDEQIRMVAKMARTIGDREGYFTMDFTDSKGQTVDSIDWEGHISSEKVAEAIKRFYRTGKARNEGVVGQFHGDKKPALDGGPGSGNHGHAGRPGKVGGSAPATGQSTEYRSIAKAAREFNGSGKEFYGSLNKAQQQAIKEQHDRTKTKETVEAYAGRIQRALKNAPEPEPQKNKVVNGKDISRTYTYKGDVEGLLRNKEGKGEAGTHEIDTIIEDVLHQQGFDGVPKVVSTEEFDKYTEEHPEMPILMRAITAENKERLDEFVNDLESGFFYVDCGVGGAQYGYGMYTAGAYQGEPASEVEEWNDPELETDVLGSPFVLKVNGEGYKAKAVYPEEVGELYLGVNYLYEGFKDGERHIYHMDEDSLLWVDENGSLVEEEKLNEILRNQDGTFFEMEPMDLSIYYDKQKREKEEHIAGASREMDHYLAVGMERIFREHPPKAPAGMTLAREDGEQQYYYFDASKAKTVKDNPPEDGKVIVLTDAHGGQPALYRVDGEKIVRLDGKYSLKMNPKYAFETGVPDGWKWAEVEGKIENFSPVGTARMMTLDTSARVISSADIGKIINGYPTNAEYEEADKKYFDENMTGYTPDEIEYMRHVYHYPGYKEPGFSKAYETLCKKISRERRDEINLQARNLAESRLDHLHETVEKMADERAEELRKKFGDDQGAAAAALGYDAINCEFHGQSMSYTVVLNRTKVILRKEPM